MTDPRGTRTRPRSERRSRLSPRAPICLASLVLASLALVLVPAPVAVGAPTATLKVSALPIPGFPHTGNILGAGAEVEVEMTISGTEYGGFPSPLTGLNLYAPAGVSVDAAGFPSCQPSGLG